MRFCCLGKIKHLKTASGVVRRFGSATNGPSTTPPSFDGSMPYSPESTNPVVFFDVAVEGDVLGRVEVELFRDVVPKAAEHFRSLCTGERSHQVNRSNSRVYNPQSASLPPAFSYQGSPFHRVVTNFIVQGGDILTRDGRSNASAWGYSFPAMDKESMKTGTSQLDQERFAKVQRHLPRTVALAHINGDPNSCGSQFFFNLSDNTHLDGKFVVVGQVLSGWEEVIHPLARCCGSRSGVPVSRAWVLACGQCGGYLTEETALAMDGEAQSGGEMSGYPQSSSLLR